MAATPSPRRSLPLFVTILYGASGLACLGLLVYGSIRVSSTPGLACLLAGVIGAILICASMPLAILLWRLIDSPAAGAGAAGGSSPPADDRILKQILENSMLSDNAKRVLFRERELQLLRGAIEEDLAHGDYNSGLTLCDDMANLFGHREEAENFRSRILQAGHASFEAKVHGALQQFDHILASRDWAVAHREAARIKRLFPNHHLVGDIDQRILQAREDHKRFLEAQFIEAAKRDDVDSAMVLLKELDRYLTRDEAARIANVAQGVVFKHRENLSMQFKLAVNDHRWSEAAQIGDGIIAEYPNTKMADEVRSMIDVIRVRATQAAVMAGN